MEVNFNNIERMINSKDKIHSYVAAQVLAKEVKKGNTKAKKYLNKISLFDAIKSYKDVCRIGNFKELKIEDFAFLPEDQRLKSLNFHKLKNIEKLFNGDWILNWKDGNQRKYYPWFENKKTVGLVFSRSFYYFDYSAGTVAYFKDEKTSDFIGKIFLELYKGILE